MKNHFLNKKTNKHSKSLLINFPIAFFQIDMLLKNINSAYNTLDLINDIVNEIGSLPKASKLLGYGSTYLSDLKQRITNSRIRGYNPNYKFSDNNLKKFQQNLEKNLGNNALKCILLIKRY
ncbi:unnamed protein product, partial [marine sediment metagenome]